LLPGETVNIRIVPTRAGNRNLLSRFVGLFQKNMPNRPTP
jgi:hypothetical protein